MEHVSFVLCRALSLSRSLLYLGLIFKFSPLRFSKFSVIGFEDDRIVVMNYVCLAMRILMHRIKIVDSQRVQFNVNLDVV